ncbi:membrane protein [Trypanosoma grayi]|uniref:membrane protein n=1 Tax=Trypanosoma grayi TaxID=71804 RepID=UPI0004F4006B|nr:membrane protein [Trypanosoma grayi]KEG06671.1 membrane protein [Trypanosoma grayi]
MSSSKDAKLIIAGSTGLIAVVAGAFGAHALQDRLLPKQHNAWTTAVKFNLLHAVGEIAVIGVLKCVDPQSPAGKHLTRAFYLFAGGTALFSGSIYALCLGAPKMIGPVTPIGGVTLMLGWISVALAGL